MNNQVKFTHYRQGESTTVAQVGNSTVAYIRYEKVGRVFAYSVQFSEGWSGRDTTFNHMKSAEYYVQAIAWEIFGT